MSRKNNWTCSACGMSSGRRSSLKRHIDNKNIHNGKGTIVPITEYLAGVDSGLYDPSIDYYLNTQKRTTYYGRKKTNQEADAAAESNRISQSRNGAEIFYKIIFEDLAHDFANDLRSGLKGKPEQVKWATIAYYLKQYERASAGKVDLESDIEELVRASGQFKFWQDVLSKSSGGTRSPTKSNEVNKPTRESPHENQAGANTKTHAGDSMNPDGPQMTDEPTEDATKAEKISNQDMKADIVKIKQLLGKNPGEIITPEELKVECTKAMEIAKIVLKHS